MPLLLLGLFGIEHDAAIDAHLLDEPPGLESILIDALLFVKDQLVDFDVLFRVFAGALKGVLSVVDVIKHGIILNYSYYYCSSIIADPLSNLFASFFSFLTSLRPARTTFLLSCLAVRALLILVWHTP